jgi:tight adherence protein C
MVLFLISATVTVFVLSATVILMVGRDEGVNARLMEVAARQPVDTSLTEGSKRGLAGIAATFTSLLKPLRSLISGTDEDMAYRLTLAGFRRPEHVEVYTAVKMLLPVVGVVAGTFFGSNMIAAILVGAVAGFFGPDLVVTHMISARQESVNRALPDALDLLVICMEAGLGIDQAMTRVADEIKMTSPPLADELQTINREQRAGKRRLDAWRSMAERVDVPFVRQFVSMLVQSERFGTPIAHALGQFSDMMRMRRTQEAQEIAAKTGAKLLFPLVLFIFPSIFVVSIGPALLGIVQLFQRLFK